MRRNINIPPIVISVLFCGLSIFLFNEYGVKIVNDSDRYLEYARNLKNGFYFDKHNFWYIGYVFFIFVVQLIHKGPFAIVVAQYLLSFIAVLALYKSSLFVFKDTQSATITAVSYMLFMEILTWNSYILCESLYCSLTCISLYFLTSSQRHSSLYAYVIAVIVVSITILTKPTGIALFGAILAIVLLRLWKHVKGKGTRIAFVFVLTTFFALIVNRMLFTFRIIENYELGEIIYAITTLPYNELYDSLIINPPRNIQIPSADNPPLWRVIIFIAYNPLYFLQLFCSKLFFFYFISDPIGPGHTMCLFFVFFCLFISIVCGLFQNARFQEKS